MSVPRTEKRRRFQFHLSTAIVLLLVIGLLIPSLGYCYRRYFRNGDVMTGADWPFDQPRNCAAITMRQILDCSEPILLVSHDADDHGWQFIGSTDANFVDGKVVALERIVNLDPTVREVADLPPGWQAVRARVGAPWTRRKHP